MYFQFRLGVDEAALLGSVYLAGLDICVHDNGGRSDIPFFELSSNFATFLEMS